MHQQLTYQWYRKLAKSEVAENWLVTNDPGE